MCYNDYSKKQEEMSMKYNVRVMNNKTNEIEYKTVTAEELKALYWSIWYDIFDVVAVTE